MAHEDMLTEGQLMMRAMARDFCQSEVAPRAAETDAGRFPSELAEQMARLGLLGMTAPAEYNGGGADEVSVALVMEEISAVCPSLSVVFAVQNSLVCAPLSRYGSEAQKNETLRALARGKKLGCFALSEPSAGSDAAALQTRAQRAGDEEPGGQTGQHAEPDAEGGMGSFRSQRRRTGHDHDLEDEPGKQRADGVDQDALGLEDRLEPRPQPQVPQQRLDDGGPGHDDQRPEQDRQVPAPAER